MSFWTHSSLRSLPAADPLDYVDRQAANAVLRAMQAGWSGPPFDPLALARHLGVHVVPKDDVADARIVPLRAGGLEIQYNPNKSLTRIRFSIAHELAHTFFPDCQRSVRQRLAALEMKHDDWQLEMVCNRAAAGLLMPLGSFPELKSTDVNIDRILALRKKFAVSVEAVLIRTIHLTGVPCAMFVASSRDQPAGLQRYVLDYTVRSRAWELSLANGASLPKDTVLSQCQAIGYTAKGHEQWYPHAGRLHVECVGLQPYRGQTTPRVGGIVRPAYSVSARGTNLEFLVGDALQPRGAGIKVIAHVVNDKTPNWGAGFGLAMRTKWQFVQRAFQKAVARDATLLTLGNTFYTEAEPGVFAFQMICQRGYGPSPTPRLHYQALTRCLEQLADFAQAKKASIHMPRIGAGQGGGSWQLIEQLLDETLCMRGLPVTIYSLPNVAVTSRSDQLNLFDHAKTAS